MKMAGLVSGLSRQRELHVNLGRRWHPRRRHLADADLVGQRDLQHLLRIAGGAAGQRCPSRANDREEPIGLEGLELLNELDGIHLNAYSSSPITFRESARNVNSRLTPHFP